MRMLCLFTFQNSTVTYCSAQQSKHIQFITPAESTRPKEYIQNMLNTIAVEDERRNKKDVT